MRSHEIRELVRWWGSPSRLSALLGPLSAAFVHVASELAFILNSARLLPRGAGSAERVPGDQPPIRAINVPRNDE
jgi:hypothetical protein